VPVDAGEDLGHVLGGDAVEMRVQLLSAARSRSRPVWYSPWRERNDAANARGFSPACA
jgi:hypothetical protein